MVAVRQKFALREDYPILANSAFGIHDDAIKFCSRRLMCEPW
jgi:hypothetical protein